LASKEKRQRLLMAGSGGIGILCLLLVLWYLLRYALAAQAYTDLKYRYTDPVSAGSSAGADYELLKIDFDQLQQAAPDVIGWIDMDGLNISYPIVQGSDNDFYIHHAPDKTETKSGSLFLDASCTGLHDPYSVIYGHNMKDGSMFARLRGYTSQSLFQQTAGGLTLYTPDGAWRYQIFAVCIVSPEDEVYTLGFSPDDIFQKHLDSICRRALYSTGVSADTQDTVLVLSTCTGKDGAQRLTVFAKRVEKVA
jgi:sortase B